MYAVISFCYSFKREINSVPINVCICILFLGPYCTEDVDECGTTPSPCRNGGTCQNNEGSYQCICVNGWTGKDCEINIDDCALKPCFNGGTCHDKPGYYYCECPVGKKGEFRAWEFENWQDLIYLVRYFFNLHISVKNTWFPTN